MNTTWQRIKREAIEKVDIRIDRLFKQSGDIKGRLSLYLEKDARDFTWGVKRMMLGNIKGDEQTTIRKYLNDLDNIQETMGELLSLREDLKKLGD